MAVVVSAISYMPGGTPFASAHLRCHFCGSESEPQTAAGAGAKADAMSSARSHAKIIEGWGEAHQSVGKGRKAYSLLLDKCPACVAQPLP